MRKGRGISPWRWDIGDPSFTSNGVIEDLVVAFIKSNIKNIDILAKVRAIRRDWAFGQVVRGRTKPLNKKGVMLPGEGMVVADWASD